MVRLFAIVSQHFNHKFIKLLFAHVEKQQNIAKLPFKMLFNLHGNHITNYCRRKLFSILVDVGQCTSLSLTDTLKESTVVDDLFDRITIDGQFFMPHCVCVWL